MEPGGTGLESESLCIIYILLSNTQKYFWKPAAHANIYPRYNDSAKFLQRQSMYTAQKSKSKYHGLVSFLLCLSHKSCYSISILVHSYFGLISSVLYWDRTSWWAQAWNKTGHTSRWKVGGRGSRCKITDFLKTCSQQGPKFPLSNSPSKNYP